MRVLRILVVSMLLTRGAADMNSSTREVIRDSMRESGTRPWVMLVDDGLEPQIIPEGHHEGCIGYNLCPLESMA